MAEQSRLYVYDTSYPTGWKPWDGSVSAGSSGQITVSRIVATTTIALTTDTVTYHIDPNGSNRDVILPDSPNTGLASGNVRVYTVRNLAASGATTVLNVKATSGGSTLYSVPAGFYASFVYDGTEWVVY